MFLEIPQDYEKQCFANGKITAIGFREKQKSCRKKKVLLK